MTLRGPSGVRRRGVDTLGRPGRWTCLMLSCSWCGPPIYAGRRRRMHVFQPNYIDARQEKDEKRNEKRRKGSTYTASVRTCLASLSTIRISTTGRQTYSYPITQWSNAHATG
ncbi:hypothetical protein LZ31DRAFT_550677 [Colletotrichum somersetense]|nr:hypothetical protein LZ31DRAFT_550677 [Colletotrichum somersetense]